MNDLQKWINVQKGLSLDEYKLQSSLDESLDDIQLEGLTL